MAARPRFTYANVMATLAVLLGLAGGAVAYASHLEVKSSDIVNGAVKSEDLANSATVNNARKVDGSSIRQISRRVPADTDPGAEWDRLFKIHGLIVHTYCPNGANDEMYLRVRTTTDNGIVGVGALNGKSYDEPEGTAIMFPGVDNDFDAGGEGEQSFVEIDDSVTVLSYGRGNDAKPVVTATFLANQYQGGNGRCSLVGTVVHKG